MCGNMTIAGVELRQKKGIKARNVHNQLYYYAMPVAIPVAIFEPIVPWQMLSAGVRPLLTTCLEFPPRGCNRGHSGGQD